jgi:hypothetical protein
MRFTKVWIIVLAVTISACPLAMADGIDLVPYFTRTGGGQKSILGIVGMVVLLMIANYVLNLIVIGFPAIKTGQVKSRIVVIGLVWLTLLGQVADRLGALLAGLFAVPLGLILGLLGLGGEGSWLWPLLGLNFFFSGIAVGSLSFYFLRKRWHIGKGASWVIASVAAIVTNPAWAMYLWFV